MPALREILAKFGFDIDDKKLLEAKKQIDGFKAQIEGLKSQVTGGAFLGGMKDLVKEIQEQGDALNDTADQLGVGRQMFQQWGIAAKLSGAEAGDLAVGIRVLQKNAADAAGGSADMGKAFKDLGVDVKDGNGKIKDTGVLLREVGLGLAKIEDPAKRNATALQVMGKGALKLGPMFNEGQEGLDGLLGRLEELGGGFTDDALEKIGALGDSFDEYEVATRSLKGQLASGLFPILSKGINLFNRGIAAVSNALKGTNTLKAALSVLTIGLVVLNAQAIKSALSMALAWAPAILGAAFLILLVDDLMTAIDGGNSVVGTFGKRILAAAFGADTASDMIKSATQAVKGLGAEVDKADTFGGKVEAVFSSIGFELVKFFADDIPEAVGFLWEDTGGKLIRGLEMTGAEIDNTLTGWANTATNAAKGLIDGLVNGIINGEQWVIDAISGLGDKVIAKLRSVFDWHSPSGLTEDLGNIGLDMGLVKGIAKGAPKIDAQVDKTFGGALDGLGGSTVGPSPGALAAGGAGGPVVVHQNNEINNTFPNSVDPGSLRDSVRAGTQAGLGDLRGALSSLEAQA